MNLSDGTIKQLPEMWTTRSEHSASVLNGSIYVIGGRDVYGSIIASVERFDVDAQKWIRVAAMHTGRTLSGSAVLDGNIYTIGGSSNRNVLETVECYNPGVNKWIRMAPLIVPRRHPHVVAVDGFIYVFGGFNRDKMSESSVERFDPKTDTWKQVRRLMM